MSRIDTHAFGLWWRLAKGWLSTKFSSISVDLTPVEDKLDEVKEAVENIDIDTSDLAKQGSNANATNTAILAKFDDITIDTSNLATKNLEQFFNITGATSYTAASTVEILNELVSIWEDVFDAYPAEVPIEGTYIERYLDGHHRYEIPATDEDVLG